jgi:endo-1,4-beta-xylanase
MATPQALRSSRNISLSINILRIAFTGFVVISVYLPVNSQPLPQGTRLKELADKAGLLLGVRTYMLSDAYNTVVEREFNTGTTTWYARWEAEGATAYDNFNKGVNWLYAKNMRPMNHMLFGPDQYEKPRVIALTEGAALDTVMENRIRGIIQSNGNSTKVNVWNIVNEAFQWSGDGANGDYWPATGAYAMVWLKMGWENDNSGLTGIDRVNDKHPIFIRKAFEYARKYTTGKLELRDNTIEFSSKKSRAFYQLVKHLKNSGVPLDAIGMQCHFEFGFNTVQLAQEIRKYRALGLQVYFTEVDISRGNQPWTTEVADLQKQEYRKLITVALEEGVSQVHFWGLRDADENWLGDKNPLLFDKNSSPKPAYYGVQEALVAYNAKTTGLFNSRPGKAHLMGADHKGPLRDVLVDGRVRKFKLRTRHQPQ